MAWLGLLVTLRWNWHEHEHDRPTICRIVRLLPRPVAMTLLAGIFTCLAVHIWRGYPTSSRR